MPMKEGRPTKEFDDDDLRSMDLPAPFARIFS